jgi:hypothetical protein
VDVLFKREGGLRNILVPRAESGRGRVDKVAPFILWLENLIWLVRRANDVTKYRESGSTENFIPPLAKSGYQPRVIRGNSLAFYILCRVIIDHYTQFVCATTLPAAVAEFCKFASDEDKKLGKSFSIEGLC